jgi:hypothetical protein
MILFSGSIAECKSLPGRFQAAGRAGMKAPIHHAPLRIPILSQ